MRLDKANLTTAAVAGPSRMAVGIRRLRELEVTVANPKTVLAGQ